MEESGDSFQLSPLGSRVSRRKLAKTSVDVLPARVHGLGPSEPETMEGAVAAALDPDLAARGSAIEGMAHAATLPLEETVAPGHAHCQRCEVIPRKVVGPGTLYLNLPHTHTLGKVLQWLRKSGLEYAERTGVVTVAAPQGSLVPVLNPLLDLLTSTERALTRVVFQSGAQPLQMLDLFGSEDISTFVARASSDWLLDLLREERLNSHFQPIVDGDGEVFAHECLLRGSLSGETIMPGPILAAAKRADLLFQTDQAARRAALRAAARERIDGKVFVNFTPNSIFDAAYCLDSTVRLVDELGLAREQVVFEVTETESIPDLGHLKAIVDYYREKGFGVALDDLGSGFASLQVLLEIRPDYAKVDIGLVRDVHLDERKAILTSKLLEAAHALGARTVFEGVEREEEWAWARSCGVDLAQGYLFGRPAAKPKGANAS